MHFKKNMSFLLMFLQYTFLFSLTSGQKNFRIFSQIFFFDLNFLFNHYEAKLCILFIVSGIYKKDAHFVLILFSTFLRSFRQYLTCLKTCLWNPGTYRLKIVRLSSAHFGLVMTVLKNFSKTVRRPIRFLICMRNLIVSNVYLMLGETYFGSLQLRLC